LGSLRCSPTTVPTGPESRGPSCCGGERRAGTAADHVHAARLALAQLRRHLPYALNTPPHYERAWSSPRICCMDIGVREPAHYADMPRGGRVLMIAEDGLDRGDDCREPVALVAADRYDGVTLSVMSELYRRFASEPTGSADPSRSGTLSARSGAASSTMASSRLRSDTAVLSNRAGGMARMRAVCSGRRSGIADGSRTARCGHRYTGPGFWSLPPSPRPRPNRPRRVRPWQLGPWPKRSRKLQLGCRRAVGPGWPPRRWR